MREYELLTTRQIEKLIEKLGGIPAVMEIVTGKVRLIKHRGPLHTPWRTVFSPSQGELDLVTVTGAELGLTTGGTMEETHQKAIQAGFAICPEDATDYLDVPWDIEQINIGMRPVLDEEKNVLSFTAVDADRQLECSAPVTYDPNYVWPPEQKWAFVLPRTTS